MCWINGPLNYHGMPDIIVMQGLTQTILSSSPHDHQLRGSGGPTIFLVVLTTTTLVNLEPNFLTPVMCFHIVNFLKPQHG